MLIAKEWRQRLDELDKKLGEGSNFENIRDQVVEIGEKINDQLSIFGKKLGSEVALTDFELEEFDILKTLKKSVGIIRARIFENLEVDYESELRKIFLGEDGIPEDLISLFFEEFLLLEDSFKSVFFERLKKSVLNNPNGVLKITSLKWVMYEISRINKVKTQKQEILSDTIADISINYSAYVEFLTDFKADQDFVDSLSDKLKTKILNYFNFDETTGRWIVKEGVGGNKLKSVFKDPQMASFVRFEYARGKQNTAKKKSKIDMDVPIIRESENGEKIPLIYETKSYSRRVYGEIPSNYNQLLKYNEAVERGIADGATIEITGLINSEFLKWACGERISEIGHVPNVEIIYNIPLPSGNEYRFVLKRGKVEKGLSFFNEDSNYSEEDRIVIKGIQNSLIDKSFLNIFTKLRESEFDYELQKFERDPLLIDDVDVYEKYNLQRLNSLWKQLTI